MCLSGLPRVQKRDPESGEIFHITRNYGEIMLNRSSRNQTIRHIETGSS